MLFFLSLQADLLSQTIEELTLRADSLENRKQVLLNEIDIIKQQLKTTKQEILLKESHTESNLNIIAETKRNTKLTETATGGNVIADVPAGAKLVLMKFEYGYWLAQYNNKIGMISNKKIVQTDDVKLAVDKYYAVIDTKRRKELEESKQSKSTEKEERRKEDEERRKRYEERKRKEAEIRAEEIEKIKALGIPINFEKASVTFNSIGNPEAKLVLKNVSENTVDAYTVDIHCFDRFGKKVYHYVDKDNIVTGISQETISPAGIDHSVWPLYGHETTSVIKIYLAKVHFTDGTTWYSKKGKVMMIEGKSIR